MAGRSLGFILSLFLALFSSASGVRYTDKVEDLDAEEAEEETEGGKDAIDRQGGGPMSAERWHAHGSPCSGSFIDEFKKSHPKKFRVALVFGERLNRLPMRLTERMKRLATSLQGVDLFVATEAEDEKFLPSLLPKPTKVGFFNRSVVGTAPGGKPIKLVAAAPMQLLRMRDAFELIRKQEKEQGWKYDVVARLRTESVMADSCMVGLNEGCVKPGAWYYAIAAHVTSANESTLFQSHDRAYLGRRDDMERLFRNAIPEQVDKKSNSKVVYGDLACKSGDYEICTQEIKVVPNEKQVKEVKLMGDDRSGEFFLYEVAHAPEKRFKLLDGKGPLYGMGIRRFSYDYMLENLNDVQMGGGCEFDWEKKMWKRLKEAKNPSSGFEYDDGSKRSKACGYAAGCENYPPVSDHLTTEQLIQKFPSGVW